MRRAVLLMLVLLPLAAAAQESRRSGGDWIPYPGQKGCIGGDACRGRQLRLPLEDEPVLAVRFQAHDQIGTKAEGVLRVKIDGNTIRGYIDVPRGGSCSRSTWNSSPGAS